MAVLQKNLILLLMVYSTNGQRPLHPDLPDPRIVVIGLSGAGKSSLANALLGCDPRGHECLFQVCPGTDSCTKETTYGMGPWLGSGQNFTVVDTPGFGDSDGEDEELIEEMMDVLANIIEHSDTMLLVLKGTETRFGEGLQNMLKRMTLMFGKSWWEYLVVGVSFWAYDEGSIEDRECEPDYPEYCRDESWYAGEINQQLNEKFGVERNFTFVFTDSFSQTGSHLNNPFEQEHWQEETGILWDITTSRPDSFGFMTINDFMDENAKQRAEIKWLNDVITNNISEIHKHFDELEENLKSTIPSVGSIIAWLPTGPDPEHHHVDPIPIPNGWQRCDGSVVTDNRSPFYGLSTPNINGEEYFIRGGRDDKSTMTQDDLVGGHSHTVTDTGHTHTGSASSHSHSIYSADWNKQADENNDSNKPKVDYDSGCFETQSSQCHYTSTLSASPSVTIDSKVAGIQVDRTDGIENRPKNMAAVYIIRIS